MARQPRHPTLVFPSGQRLAEVNMMPRPFLALSWPNVSCVLKAAICIAKQTLAILAAPTAATAVDARESGFWPPLTVSDSCL